MSLLFPTVVKRAKSYIHIQGFASHGSLCTSLASYSYSINFLPPSEFAPQAMLITVAIKSIKNHVPSPPRAFVSALPSALILLLPPERSPSPSQLLLMLHISANTSVSQERALESSWPQFESHFYGLCIFLLHQLW